MRHTKECLRRIKDFLNVHKMKLVPCKTDILILKRQRKRDNIPFTINNVEIFPLEVVKYLGINFDEKGIFGKHRENSHNKKQMNKYHISQD